MRTWSELQEYLQTTMGTDVKVYYQPPENLKLKYPCVVFELSNALTRYATNNPYLVTKRYTVTLMTKTSDNHDMVDKILMLPMCTFDRQFISDLIVHDVFTIYF